MRRASRYEPLPADRAAVWAGFGNWQETYFSSLVGLIVEEIRVDYCRMRLPWRSEITQPAGVAHGGAIATLIDSVVVPAIGAGYEDRRDFVTIDMQIQYRGALVNTDAIAEGWVARRGRSMVFCEVDVTTAAGAAVAKGLLTYRVLGAAAE